MRMMVTWIGILVALSALLSSCMSAGAANLHEFSEAPLFGMIYDQDNRPVANVKLQVDGKPVAESDLNGRFLIPRLARGDHKVVATKPEFETLRIDLNFSNETQVLYLQMFSQSQLLAMAETRITQRNWQQARTLLERAGKIDRRDPVYRYVVAILDYRTGNPTQAASDLSQLLASGVEDPSVDLFLADIYQYSLKMPQKAIPYLKEYLAQKGDDAVSRRLSAIESQTAKPDPAEAKK